MQKTKTATNIEILKAMRGDPEGSQRDWAARVGISESTLRSKLAGMEKLKLIKKRKLDDRYQLTGDGTKELLQVVPKGGDK